MNAFLEQARRIAALTLFSLALAGTAQAQDEAQHLPAINLAAGMYSIHAEVARSERERELGLMFRKAMAQTDGMLFVFSDPQRQCFWMRNTLIPLSAAFIADDGQIINIVEMAPQTDESHCSAHPVRFVLEMNQNWFTKHGINPGAYVTGEPFTR
jgi:uncharacterized membrane protein (UPF0127 family)